MSEQQSTLTQSTQCPVPNRVAMPQPNGGVLYAFPKGVSGNPGGARTAGAFYREHLNAMAGWTEKQLRAAASDKQGSAAKRQAAKTQLRALRDGFYHATPYAANDLDRIADRTEGKPTQRLEVARVLRDPDDIGAELAALLAESPDLAQYLTPSAGQLPVLDVPATPIV